jgi:hypothetical protein
MKSSLVRKQIYPALMILGAGILLFRTIRLMFFENGLETLVIWVNVLTVVEMLVDLACIVYSVKWLINHNKTDIQTALRLGAFAAIFHAFRVLIFVIGRVGPWVNFDVKPEHRAAVSIDIFWVYFAGILSIMGIVGVVAIWLVRRKKILITK